METGKVSDFKKKVHSARKGNTKELQALFEKGPNEFQELFTSEPLSLAELLVSAGKHFSAKKATPEELKTFASAFSKLPELSARLIGGMGA